MIAFGISHGGWLFFLALVNMALAVTGLLAILKRKPLQAIVSACMIIFLSVFLLWVFPLVNQRLQGSLHKYSLYAKDKLREGGSLIVFGLNKPSIVFYSGHKIISTNKKSALLEILGGMDRAVIITKAKSVRFLTSLGFKVLEKDEQYAILERK